jgi:hypothetical protein
MTAPTSTSAEASAGAPVDPPPPSATFWVLRLLAGWALLFGTVALGAYFLRSEIEWVGNTFVGRFGLAGMALGTFIADAFQIPPPVQFYLLATVTSASSHPAALAVICAASVAASYVSYAIGTRIAKLRWLAKILARVPSTVTSPFQKHTALALVLASASPLPYPLLCYVAGAYGLRYRLFVFFSALRVPRLIAFYFLIRAGWSLGA